MKCPFCGQKLKNINFMWFCENESCRAYDWTMEESAWQELIRTRNALDVAIQYIKHTQSVEPFWFNRLANKTLDEITAPEQKD